MHDSSQSAVQPLRGTPVGVAYGTLIGLAHLGILIGIRRRIPIQIMGQALACTIFTLSVGVMIGSAAEAASAVLVATLTPLISLLVIGPRAAFAWPLATLGRAGNTQARPVSRCVEVVLSVVDSRARIEVRDDGCSISKSDRARIFDPFYTTRTREGGSGLGLSVAHGIVGDHGGSMDVECQPDHGTRFGAELPLMTQ